MNSGQLQPIDSASIQRNCAVISMPVEWVILAVSLSHTKQAGEPGWLSRYSDQLWAGWSGVRILAGARDFYLLQNRLDRLWRPFSLAVSGWRGYF